MRAELVTDALATLTKALIHGRSWPSTPELRTEVFDYIESFFNRRRRHSTLGFLSPAQFQTITDTELRRSSQRPAHVPGLDSRKVAADYGVCLHAWQRPLDARLGRRNQWTQSPPS